MYFKKVLCGLLLIILSNSGSLFAESGLTLDEYLQAIRQSRETNIRSAILDIRVENKNVDPTVPVFPTSVMRCYIDGGKMRRDSFELGTQQVVSAAILGENKMILRVPTGSQDWDTVSVLVDRNDRTSRRHEILGYLMIPDVRFLGTYLFWQNMYDGNGWILTPEAIFGMERPLDTRLDPSTGAVILRWECNVKGFRQEFRAFVHPDKEWSVSKIELVDLIDGQEFPVIVTSVRNRKWDVGNVIFPDLIVTDYHYDGGVHYRTETITIENARFNIPIAPTVFEMEGMNLPEGSLIHNETVSENRLLQWSTQHERAVPWTGPRPEPFDLPQMSTGTIVFRIVCVALGILLIILGLRSMWKNRHASE